MEQIEKYMQELQQWLDDTSDIRLIIIMYVVL